MNQSRIKLGFAAFLVLAAMCGHTVTGRDNASGKKYRNILVLAKIEENGIQKQFEDAMVSALVKKGYNAVPSHANVTPEDLGTPEKFMALVDSLDIDALVAFTVQGVETEVVNTPSVSASVGVPVRIGFMSVFVGGSVPLGGGPKQKKIVNVEASFYNSRESQYPAWSMILSGSLNNGTNPLINDFVKKTTKALFKEKVL